MPQATSSPAALADYVRASLRDLILVLADSKRLLGTRYAAWILGAPELETGIACASMAQDEWGHGRLLYALLKDFGDDVDKLEHERAPSEYCSIEVLDSAPASWPELVVLNALVDSALTVQLEALRTSSYPPVRQRVGKLLDEEHFHAAHGTAWFKRLARTSDAGRAALQSAVAAALPGIMQWFGTDDGSAALVNADVMAGSASDLRTRYVARIAPVLAEVSVDAASFGVPSFTAFDDRTRRASQQGPDEATIAKVRGDKNRVFLMD